MPYHRCPPPPTPSPHPLPPLPPLSPRARLYLESPAGVGFSYSKNTSDYTVGDERTADDTYLAPSHSVFL